MLAALSLLFAGGLAALGVGAFGPKVLVLPVALAIAIVLLLDPFWPLLILVVSVPTDALFNRIFAPLPLSSTTALTLLTLGALVLNLPREPRAERLLPDDSTVRWVLAFALALAISTLFAQHRDLAYVDGGRLAGQLLLMLLIVRIVRTPRQMRIVVFALVAATLFSAVVVILEAKTGVRLLSGKGSGLHEVMRSRGATDQNPTTAALMQTFGVMMALALGLAYAKGRLFTLGTGILGTFGIIYSYARSAALTIIATSVVLAWRHRRSRFFPLGVALAVIALIGLLPLVPDVYWQRITALGDFDADRTLWRRVGYNLIGLDLVSKHPFFGVGPGNFPQIYMDPEYRYMPGRTLGPRDLHNMYLGIAAETGLIGAFAFIGVIVSSLTRLLRGMAASTNPTALAFAEALLFGSLAYYVGSLVTPAQYVKLTWVLVGLAVVQARLLMPPQSGQ